MDSCVLKLSQSRQKKMLKLYFFTYIILEVILTITNADETKEKVWGPGLFPDKIVMPARYFFVKLSDLENRLESKEFLKVVIDGTNKQKKPCRIWTDILDRKDNFFIVRYKIYEMCTYIKINVVYKNEHLPGSPFITNGRVYSDDCMCPMKNADELLNIWDCGKTPSLLKKQLNKFGEIDWDKQRGKVIKTFDRPLAVSLCHYVIKNNDIYRKCYGKYVDFKMFVDKTLLSLARKVKLPDVEFFANLGDWPLSTSDLPEKYPIFSWCGSTSSYDITMPTYEITESILENMGRVTVNTLSVQGNVDGPWETRIPKLFWRGRDSNKYRLELILLAKKYPDLFNVSLTNFFFYRDEEHIYGPKSDYISFYKFFDYKYQLAVDGTVAPYRMPYLLAGGSLIFKPPSKYFEHYYNQLEPNVHYVPVGTDVNDLIEKIKWARDNDEEVAKIAANGQKFSNEKISPKDIFCYHVHIFNEFSKKIVSRVRVLDGMEKVDQEKLQNCDCSTYFKDEL